MQHRIDERERERESHDKSQRMKKVEKKISRALGEQNIGVMRWSIRLIKEH